MLDTGAVTEGENGAGKAFREFRLIGGMREQAHRPVSSPLEAIVAAVGEFGDRDQTGDIRWVFARYRSWCPVTEAH